MTNKLPEVGKRYRSKLDNYIMLVSNVGEKFTDYRYELGGGTLSIQYTILTSEFCESFEEIPDQDLNRSNNTQLEEAKDDLKYHLQITEYYDKAIALDDIKEAAQNLLNALDDQKESNNHQISKEAPAKACTDSGCDDNDKLSNKDSIWKDISELPNNKFGADFLAEWVNGDTELARYDNNNECFVDRCNRDTAFDDEHLVRYCTLTDFINQQEQNTKRIEKLEELLNDKS